jgi:hypothetical protein
VSSSDANGVLTAVMSTGKYFLEYNSNNNHKNSNNNHKNGNNNHNNNNNKNNNDNDNNHDNDNNNDHDNDKDNDNDNDNNNDGRISVNVQPESVKGLALIDTGAILSYISYAYFKKLCRENHALKCQPETNLRVVSANNSESDHHGSVSLNILIGDLKVIHKFVVLFNLQCEVLIGMNFCNQYNGVINCKARCISFKPERHASLVKQQPVLMLAESVNIAKHSVRGVAVRLQNESGIALCGTVCIDAHEDLA